MHSLWKVQKHYPWIVEKLPLLYDNPVLKSGSDKILTSPGMLHTVSIHLRF